MTLFEKKRYDLISFSANLSDTVILSKMIDNEKIALNKIEQLKEDGFSKEAEELEKTAKQKTEAHLAAFYDIMQIYEGKCDFLAIA